MGPTVRFTCPNILTDYRNILIVHQCIDPFLKLSKTHSTRNIKMV